MGISNRRKSVHFTPPLTGGGGGGVLRSMFFFVAIDFPELGKKFSKVWKDVFQGLEKWGKAGGKPAVQKISFRAF